MMEIRNSSIFSYLVPRNQIWWKNKQIIKSRSRKNVNWFWMLFQNIGTGKNYLPNGWIFRETLGGDISGAFPFVSSTAHWTGWHFIIIQYFSTDKLIWIIISRTSFGLSSLLPNFGHVACDFFIVYIMKKHSVLLRFRNSGVTIEISRSRILLVHSWAKWFPCKWIVCCIFDFCYKYSLLPKKN